MFRISARFGLAILVLLLASAVPLYAQQAGLTLEGLSSTLEDLSSHVSVLIVTLADTHSRVIALETAVATLSGTASVQTEVMANASVNIRSGPGTHFGMIGTARKGDTFILVDDEAHAIWWEVEVQEGSGWIHSYYVDVVESGDSLGLETPTPSESTVDDSIVTPTPTDIPYGATHREWALMAALVGRDMVARGAEEGYLTPEELRDVINTYLQTAIEAAETCEFTAIELMDFVDVYAEMVDDAGVSEKLNVSSRWDLLSALVERRIPGFNCEENIQLRVEWIIDEYGD